MGSNWISLKYLKHETSNTTNTVHTLAFVTGICCTCSLYYRNHSNHQMAITIVESLRQQIWAASGQNLYTVIICMQRCGGWTDNGDINFYARVLITVRNLKNIRK